MTWYEANAYANWVKAHWSSLYESRSNIEFIPKLLRLPTKIEWDIVAGGSSPHGRFPWDAPEKVTTEIKNIINNANIGESKIKHTTSVNKYIGGISPYGVMDLAGNVWEWQESGSNGYAELRGLSWDFNIIQLRKTVDQLVYELDRLEGRTASPPKHTEKLEQYSIWYPKLEPHYRGGPSIGFRLISIPPQFAKIPSTPLLPKSKATWLDFFRKR